LWAWHSPRIWDIIVALMQLRGGTIEVGRCLGGLVAVTLSCIMSARAQDLPGSLVLTGTEVISVLQQQNLRSDGAPHPVEKLVQDAQFTPSERWARYVRRTYSMSRLGLLATDTALDHALREPACWDRTVSSYGQRYARAFQRRVVRNTAELGFGLLTREDLRYRRSRSASVSGRFWNGVTQAFVARMPDGTERPAYARFAAAAAAQSSTAHWTGRPVQPEWLAESLAWAVLDQVQTNLLDEFGPDFRRIGRRMWKRIRPKPEVVMFPYRQR
jgi:hypothetical protein